MDADVEVLILCFFLHKNTEVHPEQGEILYAPHNCMNRQHIYIYIERDNNEGAKYLKSYTYTQKGRTNNK